MQALRRVLFTRLPLGIMKITVQRGLCQICRKENSGCVDSHSKESKFLRDNYQVDDYNEFGECRNGVWIKYKTPKVKMTTDGKQRILPII